MLNIKQLFFCFLFGFLFSIGFSQISPSLPKWVVPEDIKTIGKINQNEIKEGYYYVLVDEQYNTLEKHNFFHYATHAVTQSGLDYVTQIEVNFDPSYQKALLHFIRVHRAGNIIDKTNSSGLKVLNEETDRSNGVLNGNKTLYVNLSDVRKGDIVEYAYSIIGYNKIYQNHFSYDFEFSYSVPVGRIKNRLIVSKNAELSILNKNSNIQPEIITTGQKEYNWIVNNPKPLKLDNGSPDWYDPYEHVQVSDFKSWKEVKHWFTSLFKTINYDDRQLKTIVDSIKTKYPGNVEKQISACVDFTQNHIRYSGNENGIYSHQPHSPEYVIKNRFGDCKDKSLFLNELLRRFDVVSYPVLLNTSKKKTIVTANPSLHEFNHCIVVINHNNKLHYIDPTITYQRGEFYERGISDYKAALVLDSSETVFSTLSPDTLSESYIVEEFDVNEETGDATLKVTTDYTGLNADNARYYFATTSLVDIQEYYRSFYLKYSGEIEVTDTVIASDRTKGNHFKTEEHYLLKNFWKPDSTKKNEVSKDFMPYSLNERLVYVTDKNRKDPLEINFPVNFHQKIIVNKTSGWNIKNNVKSDKNRFFDYVYTTNVDNSRLELDYTYRSKVDEIAPADYQEYKTKIDFVDSNIVMSVVQNASDEKVSGFNWLLVVIFITAIVGSIFVCIHFYKKSYASLYERRYDSIGGWLILVSIGLVLTPFTLLFQVIQQTNGEFSVNYFYYYFDETSSAYQPLRGYYMCITYFLNVFLVISSVFLAILFFQRKNSFRVYYVFFKLFNVVFLVVDLIVIIYLNDSTGNADRILITKQTAAVTRIIIQGAIWVPYIWYSERSRHTFVTETPPFENSTPPENTFYSRSNSI